VQTLPTIADLPQLHLFFLLLSWKQALLAPAIEEPSIFLIKPEAVASVTIILLYFVLVLGSLFLFFLTIFLFLIYSSFNIYPNLLSAYTTA